VPKNGAATRERILEVAERLVIENGFSATPVERVIAESGTSKGAFFHHFDSKVALAQALVDRYVEADLGNLQRAVAIALAATEDPRERVIGFLRIFEEEADQLMTEQSSCLYVAVLTERQLADVGSAEEINRAIVGWRETVAAMIREAYASLPARPVVDPEALADHLFATFEGAFLLCRSTGDSSHMRHQLRVLRQLVESLLRAPADLAA
jgi:TetR/AcrR family transcriptional repressor of nem operon